MAKIILFGGVVVIVGLGVFLIFQPSPETAEESVPDQPLVGEEAVSSGSEARNGETAGEASGATHVVVYSDSGYAPAELAIGLGETVVFRNESSRVMWPATAVHPSHTVYPGSGIGRCGTAEQEQIFDACGDVEPGGEWSFVFQKEGTWNYHDHRRPPETGTVIVE